MTVKITNPVINVREKLIQLDYGHVPYHKMPAGSIINEKTSYSGAVTFSNTATWNNVTSVTIDAKADGSKFLIMPTITILNGNATSFNCSIRNSSGNEIWRFAEINQSGRFGASGVHIDSPNVLAGTSITYYISVLKESSNSGTTGVINSGNTRLIIMEIKQ